jgi:hypothetical protein
MTALMHSIPPVIFFIVLVVIILLIPTDETCGDPDHCPFCDGYCRYEDDDAS